MNWQPIETAPRDGTHILGFGDGNSEVIQWSTSYGGTDGWFCVGKLIDYDATHWMPLPDLPKERGAK